MYLHLVLYDTRPPASNNKKIGVTSTPTYKTVNIATAKKMSFAKFKPQQSEELGCEVHAIPLSPSP